MGNSATNKIIPKCHDPVTILTDGNELCNKYFGDSWIFNSVEKTDCPDKYMRAQCKKINDNNIQLNTDDYTHKQIIFEKDPNRSDFKEESEYVNPINNVSYNELSPCNFSKCRQYETKKYMDRDKKAAKKIVIKKTMNNMERVLRPESTEKYKEKNAERLRPIGPDEHFSAEVEEKKPCKNSLSHNIIHVFIFFLCIYLLYHLFSFGSGLM